MAKIEFGSIIDVTNDDLKKLNKKPKKFWGNGKENAKFLGDGAFKNCTELREIVIPKTIVMSYENPFEGCEKLEKFVVEEGNKNLSTDGRALFSDLYYTEDGKILKTLIAYANASGEEYEIPQDVVAIAPNAFKGCKHIKKVHFPKLMKSIGWGAFENSGLREVVIPASVKEVYPEAFKGCKKLQEVKVDLESQDSSAMRKRILTETVSVDIKTFNKLSEEISDPRKIVAKMRSDEIIKETLAKHTTQRETTGREKFRQDVENLIHANPIRNIKIKTYEQRKIEEITKRLEDKYREPENVSVPNKREEALRRILDNAKNNLENQEDQGK